MGALSCLGSVGIVSRRSKVSLKPSFLQAFQRQVFLWADTTAKFKDSFRLKGDLSSFSRAFVSTVFVRNTPWVKCSMTLLVQT